MPGAESADLWGRCVCPGRKQPSPLRGQRQNCQLLSRSVQDVLSLSSPSRFKCVLVPLGCGDYTSFSCIRETASNWRTSSVLAIDGCAPARVTEMAAAATAKRALSTGEF